MFAHGKGVRRHLTYANVLATITAFAVLFGGAALAAGHLGRNSVGKKQLKANAVTTAKLKKNSVTAAKIKNGAVDNTTVKTASLTGADINPATVPFGRIVTELRGSAEVAIPQMGPTQLTAYPLSSQTFVQEAGQVETFVGGVDVNFAAGCVNRGVSAVLIVDGPTPVGTISTELITHIAAIGTFTEKGGGAATRRVNLGPYYFAGTLGAPAVSVTHTAQLLVVGVCESGSGITATAGGVDVIGTK